MRSDKARLGTLFVTSGWFRDVGLQPAQSDTTNRINRIAKRIVDKLAGEIDIIHSGVIFSEQDAEIAAAKLANQNIDGVLLVPLMWCEDQIVRACLKRIPNIPIILWTFTPTSALPEYLEFQTMLQGSGAVCTLQLSGMLKREEWSYVSVAGSLEDDGVVSKIGSVAAALRIRRTLSELKVGVLPFPCSQMSTTYVDEFGLRTRYGIELEYIELEKVRSYAMAADETELNEFRRECIPADHRINIDGKNLEQGIRYALATERVVKEHGLSVLAMNDVIDEMHTAFGLRPSLTNPRLGLNNVFVSMEADIAAGVCMFILAKLAKCQAFYTEVFGIDYEKNSLLLGHAGYHDWCNADPTIPVQIVPDVEYENSDAFTGCVTYFKYREGPVTVVNSVWDGSRLKWYGFEGESLPGPHKMASNCHLFCRTNPDIRSLISDAIMDGVSQHWTVIPGHVLSQVGVACGMLDIGFTKA